MVRKDKVVSFREIKRVEFNIGTDIRKVIQEAIDCAIINNCIVKFIFNSYNFEVSKYSQLNSLMDEYKCFQVEFTGYETIPSYVKLDINDNIIEIQGMKLDKPVKLGQVLKIGDITHNVTGCQGFRLFRDFDSIIKSFPWNSKPESEVLVYFYISNATVETWGDPPVLFWSTNEYIKFHSFLEANYKVLQDCDIIYNFINKKVVKEYNKYYKNYHKKVILKHGITFNDHFTLRKYSLYIEKQLFFELILYHNRYFAFIKFPKLPSKSLMKIEDLLFELHYHRKYIEEIE